MRRLVLVRHGESLWNAEGRLQGCAEVPLSPRGRRQAQEVAPLVREFDPTEAITSDLGRARETAALLGHPDATAHARWREADLGQWTGQLVDALVASDPLGYRAWREGRQTPPGGEPWNEMVSRIERALADIPEAGTHLVVTHGGPIRAVCSILLGLGPANLVPVSPASVTVIELDGSSRLRAYNLTRTHAPEEATE